ncbi:MAG: polymerase [Pyrinomonadaceae bacterium]|nr:polymerase [Pyrinomonadaceae bacterium]
MGNTTAAQIYRPDTTTKWARPLFLARVPAGFPSPAEDYIEGSLDLNRHIIKHPMATFYIRVSGDSMIDAGIYPGDVLVVDRAAEVDSGDIVIARLDDELCVKRLLMKDGQIWLAPENKAFEPIGIKDGMDFEVWGKVICSFRMH